MTVHTNETPARADVDRRDFLELSPATVPLRQW